MDMFSTLPESAAQIALAIGIALLVIDVAIFGFGTLVLAFLGLGFIVVSGGIFIGWIDTYTGAAALLSVSTSCIAVALWKPLQNLTQKTDDTVAKSDFHGHTFVLEDDIGPNKHSKHKHSGITWLVKSDTTLAKGDDVVVIGVEVGAFTVEKIST